MAKSRIINEYTGHYRGIDTYPEVWRVDRTPAKRHEIGNFYKPTLVRFDDGELLCAPFLSHLHEECTPPMREEHIVFLSSGDDGRTWREVGPRIPGREARLQLLADGTLVTTCHLLGYDLNNTGTCLMGFRRSTDRGRTWETQWMTVEDLQPGAKQVLVSRNVLEMPDGSILLGVSSYWPGDVSFPCRNWFFRSTDSGKTWSEKMPVTVDYGSPINIPFFSETDMHRFASGRIMCLSRFNARYPKRDTTAPPGLEGGTHLRIFSLDESTMTWTEEGEFLDYHNVHPQLLELRDGRLLCSYGVRYFPFGAQAVLSADEGRTWDVDHPYIISWFSWNSSCGYPHSVEMPDGSILTAYTTRRYPGDRDEEEELFSEVVRWQLQ